nr:hypothetical protein [Tanacetum cinerariifolium]
AFHHIQGLFVRRKTQAVRAFHVVDDPGDLAALTIDPVHSVRLRRCDLVPFVVVAGLERRIGEPDRVISLADDVVRRVERLTVEAVRQHGDLAVGLSAGDPTTFAG